MLAFSRLYERLDTTTSTNKKVEALVDYFTSAPKSDAAWAVYFLSGRRIKRLVTRTQLKTWLAESCQLDEWIIDECYSNVGDLAETISLLVPPTEPVARTNKETALSLCEWMDNNILTLKDLTDEEQGLRVQNWWQSLPPNLCFLVTKLLTGALRVGVSQLLVAKAISNFSSIDRPIILHRLMGHWDPTESFFNALIDPDTKNEDISRPYPFFLASPIDKPVESLGEVNQWQAEWKWDGIRAQIIKRQGQIFIWSRGEDLVTEKFPEIVNTANMLDDGTVIDGEILAWRDGEVQEFNELQRRIGRKNVSKKILSDVPVHFIAYDILESKGEDIRGNNLASRLALLHAHISPLDTKFISRAQSIHADTWDQLAEHRTQSRKHRVEGLMLKHLNSPYETGRKKGHWWKWKVDPLSIDAVLLYAQGGSGRRASLFTDYTFAVWQDDKLLPVAKAYSGLDNKEINILDKWIRANTTEKFGPVRAVKPYHVFEIGFEGIAKSTRHKAGIALRFPRILRWRTDMRACDANSLSLVKDLLKVYESGQ